MSVIDSDEEKKVSKWVWALGLSGFGNHEKNYKIAEYKARTVGDTLGFDIKTPRLAHEQIMKFC